MLVDSDDDGQGREGRLGWVTESWIGAGLFCLIALRLFRADLVNGRSCSIGKTSSIESSDVNSSLSRIFEVEVKTSSLFLGV